MTNVGVTSSLACGEDHFFCPVKKVGGGLFRGVEGAGGLNDVLRAAVIPGNTGRVALTVYPNLFPVDDQMPVIPLHGTGKGPENGIILHLIDHVVQVRVPQIDAADLIAAASPLHHDAQSHSSDPAEAIDPYFDRHNFNPFTAYVSPFKRALLSLSV